MPTVHLFIEFIIAFDSALRAGMWKAMTEYKVPDKIVRLIKAYYQRTRSQIQVGGEPSLILQINLVSDRDFGVYYVPSYLFS